MEYKKAHGCVTQLWYYVQTDVSGMLCSLCDKWAEISKGSCVHQSGSRLFSSFVKKATEGLYKLLKSLSHQNIFIIYCL